MSVPSLVELLVLALWLGAAIFFVAVVARAAFAVLPTRALAGALVGAVLPVLLYAGMAVGVAVAAAELRPSGRSLGGAIAGIVIALSCAIAQLVVGARIERVRAAIGGPIDALATSDPRRIAFGRLHAASVGWLGLATLAAIVALWLLVQRAASGERDAARATRSSMSS